MSLTTKHMDWIASLEVPADHKIVMVMLTRRGGSKNGLFVWPSMDRLAAEASLTQVRARAVVDELVYLGLLTPDEQYDQYGKVRIGWRVNALTRPATSNPLFSLLLEDQVWGASQLTLMEQTAAALMTKFLNWEDETVSLTYETVYSLRPRITRRAWQEVLKRLVKRGILRASGRGNQHATQRYKFDISALRCLAQTEPSTGSSLAQTEPSTGSSLAQTEPSTGSSLAQTEPSTGSSLAQTEPSIPGHIKGTRAEPVTEPDRREEEESDWYTSSSLSRSFESSLRENVQVGPGEAIEPFLELERLTGFEWDSTWGDWVEEKRALYATMKGKRSPIGLVYAELRRMMGREHLQFSRPAPEVERRGGLEIATGF